MREDLGRIVDSGFWKGRRVFITGHTGFKGSWLSIWLHALGAAVTGYALRPPTRPSLFGLAGVEDILRSHEGDVRDAAAIRRVMHGSKAEVVFHMAAQSLVRESYRDPLGTYQTNVMGTANVLEAARGTRSARAIVIVTSDKCYENRENAREYRESDRLGGFDPYSSSKACAELVASAYRDSFCGTSVDRGCRAAIATARAGNVIGGGDWARDRLVPDCLRALLRGRPVRIRNPHAIRPWQYVLEPLSGYLRLAELLHRYGARYSGAWNFGPADRDARPVLWVVRRMCEGWRDDASYRLDARKHPHEAGCLKLDCSKARVGLQWRPRWGLQTALEKTIQWTRAYAGRDDMRAVCLRQIGEYARS